MRSYVREHVKGISSVWDRPRRRDVINNRLGMRMTAEQIEILSRVAKHFNISKTGCAEMLLEDAIYDAAEELGLWQQPEDDSGFADDDIQN